MASYVSSVRYDADAELAIGNGSSMIDKRKQSSRIQKWFLAGEGQDMEGNSLAASRIASRRSASATRGRPNFISGL